MSLKKMVPKFAVMVPRKCVPNYKLKNVRLNDKTYVLNICVKLFCVKEDEKHIRLRW